MWGSYDLLQSHLGFVKELLKEYPDLIASGDKVP
jgi:hypothetical protein